MGAAAAVPCHDSAHGSRAPQYHSSDSRQLEKKHNTRANTGQLAYCILPRTPTQPQSRHRAGRCDL